jgi:hypothetical protein
VTGAIIALVPLSATTLTVTDMPEDVSGYGNSGAPANITTGLVLATPSGGIAPYTYAWTQVGTTPYTWTINSPAAASTSFTAGTVGAGVSTEAEFKVTVTDSGGQTATATVTAFANNGQPYDDRIDRTSRGGPLA